VTLREAIKTIQNGVFVFFPKKEQLVFFKKTNK